jgi:hypothetical protein
MYTAILPVGFATLGIVSMAVYGVNAGVSGGMIAVAIAIGLALDHDREKRKTRQK